MQSKSNKFLLGLIFVLLGSFFILKEYFSFKTSDTILFILGGALLLLYRTKRKVWSLVFGIIMFTLWIFRVFPNLGGNLLLSSIFMIPGVIFMVLYFSKHINAFLITGSIFVWFAIFIFLIFFNGIHGEMFFICMGMSFFTMYLINRNEMGKWPLFPATILIVFGILLYNGKSPFGFIFKTIPSITPILLIIIGLIIIVKAFIVKKN